MGKIDFSNRSSAKEWMDEPIADKEIFFQNLREIEWINRFTGGPATGFKAIKQLIGQRTGTLNLVEIGFGSGDMLQYLVTHQHLLPVQLNITAIDILPETLEYIQLNYPSLLEVIDFQLMDYREWLTMGNQTDLIYTGLFCHHLADDELVEFLTYCTKAKLGFVINDLNRAPLPYYFIKYATQLFARSPFTRHDAPLSVLRAFTEGEWKKYLHEAGVKQVEVHWKWAYRYLITGRNEQ